ncbi:winged helix-turn-helix domain-containing protein [Mycobacterium seoulense]|uniref:winged helix-turn-helix domain-containing protein n=1 Tax=Mycobacterium seoulense TaxID=386911 RepID=UPI003CEF1BB1
MARVPSYAALLWPSLRAVIELGGSATIDQIDDLVITRGKYSREVRGVQHTDRGPDAERNYRTEIQYRLAWARTYLKGMGLLERGDRRGLWRVTPRGRKVKEADVDRLHVAYRASIREKAKQRRDELERTSVGAQP